MAGSTKGTTTIAVILIVLFSGCFNITSQNDGVAVDKPRVGEVASYRLVVYPSETELSLAYRWVGEGIGRDGFGHERLVLRAETWMTDELAPPENERPSLVAVDAETGTFLSMGYWEEVPVPRIQLFSARSPVWVGFPGLHQDEGLGMDNLRLAYLPLFVINSKLAQEPDISEFVHLGVPFTVQVDKEGRAVVEHPDGAVSDPGSQIDLRYKFEYDGEGFFPKSIVGYFVEGGRERLWFEKYRVDSRSGSGEVLLWNGEPQEPLGAPPVEGFEAWESIPPEGESNLALSLHEAVEVAQRDAGFALFRVVHPEAYLVSASYRYHQETQILVPGVPSLPGASAIWRMEFADPSGAAYYVEVRRALVEESVPGADVVYFSEARTFDFVPPRGDLPQRLYPMDGAIQVAEYEIGRRLGEFLHVDFRVSLDERLVDSEHAAYWQVGEYEPLVLTPKTQITVSAETARTLVRAESYE
jgi:hypothetical protein